MTILKRCPECQRMQSRKHDRCIKCDLSFEGKTLKYVLDYLDPKGRRRREIIYSLDEAWELEAYHIMDYIYEHMKDVRRHEYQARYKVENKELIRNKQKEAVRALKDNYVFHTFVGRERGDLKREDVPPEILALKRVQIMAIRELRNHKNKRGG